MRDENAPVADTIRSYPNRYYLRVKTMRRSASHARIAPLFKPPAIPAVTSAAWP